MSQAARLGVVSPFPQKLLAPVSFQRRGFFSFWSRAIITSILRCKVTGPTVVFLWCSWRKTLRDQLSGE